MNAPLALVAAQPKRLTAREECDLLRRALAERGTPAIRLKLAQLLNRLDAFGETIALFDQAGPPADYLSALTLAAARLGRAMADDLAHALAAAKAAEGLADNAVHRAEAVALQAVIWRKTGDAQQALQALAAALALDPANRDALRLLCSHWLAQGEPDQALALCDAVEAAGHGHVQALGMRSLALAQRGEFGSARAVAGLDWSLSQTVPPAPDGWDDLPSFHAALVQEVMDSADIRNGRHGTASIASLRVDEPATANTPAMRALQQLIAEQVRAAIAKLPDTGHPWLRIRPDAAELQLWCVITGAEGRERWHMHPMGWASGGYYVAVPETVEHGDGPAGCLEFGLPAQPIGRAAARAYGSRLVRPQPGLLTLFPSHAYHRTHPHGTDALRICVAFDLMPH